MKRTALKRGKPMSRKSNLRPVSEKQKKRLEEYNRTEPMGPKDRCNYPNCCHLRGQALDRHHPYSRRGENLFRFVMLCRVHHQMVHDAPNTAFDAGWLQPEYRGLPHSDTHPVPWT